MPASLRTSKFLSIISREVASPTLADPSEIRTVKLMKNQAALYDLIACIDHHGRGLDEGHYTATCARGPSWLKFDDDSVHSVKSPVSADNYVWFLLRSDTPSEPSTLPQQSHLHPEAWPHLHPLGKPDWSFLRSSDLSV